MKSIGIVYFMLLGVHSVCAQVYDSTAAQYARSILRADLRKHLEILASDEYEGRETGFKGQKMAASYIENEFRSMGLAPGNGSSFQQSFPIVIEKAGGTTFSSGNAEVKFLDDFFYLGSYPEQQLKADELVFIGFGIDNAGYSDYKGVDIKDKVVVLIEGEPKNSEGQSLLKGDDASQWSMDRMKKIRYAQEKGARTVISVIRDYDRKVAQFKAYVLNPKVKLRKTLTEKKNAVPSFYVSERVAEKWLGSAGLNLSTVDQKASKGKSLAGTVLKVPISISMKSDVLETTSENVLGFIEGTDLKHEVLVITAHYDHIGRQGDKIFNGADDDGSGTVAVLELAEAFSQAKKAGKGPRRSVLFMTVSGEEKGLLGSEWYTENPVYPLENTVCDLNIDMIGRMDEAHAGNPFYVYVIGSDKLSSDLHNISEQSNKTYSNLLLDYKYNAPDDPNRFYYRSDHYNFAKHGIPVIFYFNGVHPDYHQETDEVDKIHFEKMEAITRLVFHTAWEVANRNHRPAVDKVNDFKN